MGDRAKGLVQLKNRQEQYPSKGNSRAWRDRLPWLVFLFAILVLAAVGTTTYKTTSGLMVSEGWVAHTLEVEASLGDLRAEVLNSQGLRRGYVLEHNERELGAYYASLDQITEKIRHVKQLTQDNPGQQERLRLIDGLLKQRSQLQNESIALVKNARPDPRRQAEITEQAGDLVKQITGIVVAMENEERGLLETRERNSFALYQRMLVVLAIAFGAACVLLLAQFWMLIAELKRRRQAEGSARASEEAARHLSARLLQVQDEERRKFARELHDSLGQYLSSLNINLSLLEGSEGNKELLAECRELVDRSLTETRTISYLLHPPLLDEAGLVVATRWYVDGFSSRSGIPVKLKMPEPEEEQRLPEAAELALFRVLQESLTNIHRHSKSATAEVELTRSDEDVTLIVRDFGKGIARESLEKFRQTGGGMGVGLGGMRERLREVGGRLEVRSDGNGTEILAILPLSAMSVSHLLR